ncbi:hypothetical protein N7539_000301 [Penicillium diatomitis]|uniref:Subtelomeric hrmA-associated cluster protein AFUB-079030/YDR124W-like helical bundle domain-containing protein n=1 Tax=Penicillium diatomitis TaxID=2819901 RepID=A0A9W9XME7_9EURO|nr:uncharacterized protein N7539_000301 [Penicillium diatomitis]KAJ5495185.1 hypothetical protein N7539_000301 [Penicillium diatomitis]
MVYKKPSPTSGAMKRSASALHEGLPGWDIPPPMMAPAYHPPSRMPYAHYALIYLDNEGKIKVDESASIKEQDATLFTPEVKQNFLEILGERIGYCQPLRRTLKSSSARRVRRRGANTPSQEARLADPVSDSEDMSSGNSYEMAPLRIGDTAKVTAYYETALKHFQQLNCRMIAKAFIKHIEPRKQVRFPYNGGKPPAGSPREPDHLRKEYRIELLIYIIRAGIRNATADRLKEVAGDTKRSLKHPSHIEIIYEILRVRKMEERFERGEVDENMVVYVTNRGPGPKGDDEEEINNDNTAPTITLAAPDSIEEALLTPSSSIDHAASMATPIDPMTIGSSRSIPTGFSTAQPLTYDMSRQDRHYYNTPPQYTDSFSQSMMNTPVTAEMISPHDVSVFDYSTSQTFHPPSPDQKFDPWTPSFRQILFSPVDYTTSPVTHGMPHPGIQQYTGLPMMSPSQMHEMASSHTQALMDPSDQRALPFRNGSIGHSNELTLSHPV